MSVTAYKRPFQPIDFSDRAAAVLSFDDMIHQLREEDVYHAGNRNALTLIHEDDLTVVLTVVRAGTECEDHLSQALTLFVVLQGELTIESASDGGMIHLHRGFAGALARDVRHKLMANSDCAYLMVLGMVIKADKVDPAVAHETTSRAAVGSRSGSTAPLEYKAINILTDDLVRRLSALPPADAKATCDSVVRTLTAKTSPLPSIETAPDRRVDAPLNFIGEAFLLALVGFGFLLLLPPVGVVMILLATVVASGALLQQMVRGRRRIVPGTVHSRVHRRSQPQRPEPLAWPRSW